LPILYPILQAQITMLTSIALTQFKNYNFVKYDFKKRIVAIFGQNGKGKTNLLDAIYHLAFTKSYFLKMDSANVQHNTDGYRIEGVLQNDKVAVVYRSNAKKEISFNQVVYTKASQHIGKYPTVFIAPDDTALITEGSEGRRRFLDILISQIDPEYLLALSNYNRLLQQRNSLLKYFAETKNRDYALLDTYNEQIEPHGNYIFDKRKQITIDLLQLINNYYNKIANNKEQIKIEYISVLHNSKLSQLFKQNIEKDIALQRTTAGIHKDDINFSFNEGPFKTLASQGQRKSLLFAIKLAEFELLQTHLQKTPFLLLDDVFEKLDEQRMHNFLDIVCNQNSGQVFITDTHQERLKNTLQNFNADFELIEII
jgi:DNA replication and repair protein RecF